MSGINALPDHVGLSGNGARLMEITNGVKDLSRLGGTKDLMNLVVKKIFGLNEKSDIKLVILNNPKEATAVGGILGFKDITRGEAKNADRKNYMISLGTDKDIYNPEDARKLEYKSFIDSENNDIENVSANLVSFFEFFFDELWYEADLITHFGVSGSYNREKLKSYFTNSTNIRNSIREVINNKIKSQTSLQLEETMFFYPIKAFLYDFSRIIASNRINDFKG